MVLRVARSSRAASTNMEKYSEIRDVAFKMAHEEMMSNFSDENLLSAVQLLKKEPSTSFGLIKNLTQNTVAELFPLISNGTWVLKESYYCSNKSFSPAYPTPRFVDVDSYNEFIKLKEKYPKGFDFYKGGREALREYDEKYPDFWGDARMLDGRAEFRFGKTRIAPYMVPAHFERKEHPQIQDDELFLIIYESACYVNNSTSPGICFVLTPNKETYEERELEIYKKFKSHIIAAYLRLVMKKYDEEKTNELKKELLCISEKLIAK